MRDTGHENLRREETLTPGSDRSFGVVMAVAFTLLAGLLAWRGGGTAALVCLALAAGFGLAALIRPGALQPLNRLWFRFGLLLHKLVNPLVMGLMFFAVITPIGLLMRLLGQRPLAMTPDRTAATYWISRSDGRPAPGSMRKQY
jgi:hypothetical protein